MAEWYSGARPGWRVGPDNSPDEYTLIEAVTRGGEGDVWLARRIEADGRRRGGDWAIKMLLPGHPALAKEGDDPESLLRTWDERWYKNQLDTSDLHAIPGVVVPAHTFGGPAPHPAGGPSGERGLYMASRWVDGSDLRRWRDSAGPGELPNVIAELCRIVDGLHDLGRIHGDISPGNVMVGPDGRVSLIDFTFMRFAELSRTTIALTPGFGAPESREESTMATDAYAVGAIVYYLLTGRKVPTVDRSGLPTRDAPRVVERVLLAHGWSAGVTGLVTAALSPGSAERPVPLLPWGRRLGELIAAEAGRLTCVDVVSDVRDQQVVVAGSLFGTAAAGPWRPAPGGPRAVVDVAAVADGAGRLVLFAVDAPGGLWATVDGHWRRVTDRPVRGRLAAARASDGRAVCVSLGPDEVLAHELAPGRTDFHERILKEGLAADSAVGPATARPDGPVAVLYREGSTLFTIMDGRLERVADGLRPKAAALGFSRWGDMEVLAADGPSGRLVAIEQLSSGWAPPMPVPCPVPVDDLSVLDHREGRTIAVAGAGGVWVITTGGPWTPLEETRPAERVVLRPTRSWRMQLAALIGGRVSCWVEDHAKAWVPQEPR